MRVLDGLQGNVVTGYRTAHVQYVFMRVLSPGPARDWLASVQGRVTTYRGWEQHRSATTLNLAFSYSGLLSLGVPEPRVRHLTAFKEGMDARHEALGDVGPSHVDRWEPGLRRNDVLLVITADDSEDLAHAWDELRAEITAGGGLEIVASPDAHRLPEAREHFGFNDGFSQPSIARVPGSGPRKGEGTLTRWHYWRRLALGEFVLGYRDEGGLYPPAPLGPLGDDATFMVVRKLAQDVAAFRRYIADTAARLNREPEWLRARMIGRWDNGSALERYPTKKGPPPKEDPEANHFSYGDDPEGLRCPHGAHVRRAYPRDGLGWQGRPTQRHRIIRRGMPYGAELPDDASAPDDTSLPAGAAPADAPAPDDADGPSRGLMFVCYQADIARQFEFIQGQWLNDGDSLGLGSDRDPVVAPGGDPRGMFIPGRPPVLLTGIPSFVTTRGGGYYLLPGTAGLRAMAAGSC